MSSRQRGGIIFRLLALLFFLLLLSAVYVVRHPLLRMAGRLWIVSDPIEHVDAILVIGDDNYAGDRAARAAELFQAGWAPVVVASGRKLRPYAGIAELIERDVESHGVPSTAVIRFSHSAEDTKDEAKALGQLISQHNWHHVILVTSNYHTRRARYIFRKVLPIAISVEPAADVDYDPDSWWESRRGLEIFFHETVGYLLAM